MHCTPNIRPAPVGQRCAFFACILLYRGAVRCPCRLARPVLLGDRRLRNIGGLSDQLCPGSFNLSRACKVPAGRSAHRALGRYWGYRSRLPVPDFEPREGCACGRSQLGALRADSPIRDIRSSAWPPSSSAFTADEARADARAAGSHLGRIPTGFLRNTPRAPQCPF